MSPGVPHSRDSVLRLLGNFGSQELIDKLCEVGVLRRVSVIGHRTSFYAIPMPSRASEAEEPQQDREPVAITRVKAWLASGGSGDVYDYMKASGLTYGTAWHDLRLAVSHGVVCGRKTGPRVTYTASSGG